MSDPNTSSSIDLESEENEYFDEDLSSRSRGDIASENGEKKTKSEEPTGQSGVNVQVVVRCRPMNENEKKNKDSLVAACVGKNQIAIRTQVKGKALNKTYTFDRVFGQYSTQEEVYDATVQPIVMEVLSGFNCTVFAYGQTGTGKTHTMEGGLSSDVSSPEAGVIPRSVLTIFQYLEANKKEYSVKVSSMELYNEELSDLLSDESDKALRIFEDTSGKKGVMVNGLEEVIANNADEVFKLLAKSSLKRHVAATNLNHRSSRSHSVFTITVHTKETDPQGDDIIRTGKLHLVDLAGSECIGRSGAKQQRAKEAGKINQSLLTLGRVINALVEHSGYVPYRDSKLTRLLQESLGGRAKTVVIATVSPSGGCVDETVSTLDYAHRAKNIKNRPQVNMKMTGKAYMRELIQEIAQLKRENEVLRTKNGIILPPEQYEQMSAMLKGNAGHLEELEFTLKAKEDELKELQELLSVRTQELESTATAKKEVEAQLEQTTEKLMGTQDELKETALTLQATQVVVQEQSKTEAVLSKDAVELKQTVEKVIHDKNLLHDKIGRKSAVEEHNINASQQFQSEMEQHIGQAKTWSTEVCRTQVEAHAELSEAVGQHADKQKQTLSELRTELSSSSQSLGEHEAHLSQSVSSHAEALQQQLTLSQTRAEEYQQRVSSQVESGVSASQSATESLLQHMDLQQQQVSAIGQSVDQYYATNHTERRSMVDSHGQSLQQLNTKTTSHTETQVARLVDVQSYLDSFVQQQEARTNALLATLTSGFNALIEQFKQQQSQQIAEAVQTLQATLAQDVQMVKDQSSVVTNDITEMQSAINTWNQNTETAQEQQCAALKSSLTALTSHGEQAKTQLSSAQETAASHFASVQEAGVQHVQEQKEALSQTQQTVESMQEQQQQILSTMKQEREQSLQSHDQLIAQTTASISASTDECKLKIQELTETENTFHTKRTDLHLTMEEALVTYVRSSLKVDVRTGQTPDRREFRYPSVFARTRPHDDIVREYREQALTLLPTVTEDVNSSPSESSSNNDEEALLEEEDSPVLVLADRLNEEEVVEEQRLSTDSTKDPTQFSEEEYKLFSGHVETMMVPEVATPPRYKNRIVKKRTASGTAPFNKENNPTTATSSSSGSRPATASVGSNSSKDSKGPSRIPRPNTAGSNPPLSRSNTSSSSSSTSSQKKPTTPRKGSVSPGRPPLTSPRGPPTTASPHHRPTRSKVNIAVPITPINLSTPKSEKDVGNDSVAFEAGDEELMPAPTSPCAADSTDCGKMKEAVSPIPIISSPLSDHTNRS